MFGVLGIAPYGDVLFRQSIQPSSSALSGATTHPFEENRILLSGKVTFPLLEATPLLGAQGPAVEPVRLMGVPAYGRGSNLGQKAGVVCEKTSEGGAVCSDGTYQSPTCGNPQAIANAAPAGSTEMAAASGAAAPLVPLAVGAGILGIAAFFLLR